MASSSLEQYHISDFLEWHKAKQLVLNPNFQRRSVWTPVAKTFLIDTILRKYSIPKIYIRTKIDLKTKKTIREVVDGQQRLRAIVEYAEDQFALGKRAKEYAGLKYSDLGEELQVSFLSYSIAVEQLINASDSDVLEIFSRLNSYTVKLNNAELRHAEFQGLFKWAVHESAREWTVLWEKYGVVSVRDRLRMLDDSLMAEMYGVLHFGVKDGGQAKIDALYRTLDRDQPLDEEELEKLTFRVNMVLAWIVEHLGDYLVQHPAIHTAPHFLMLFAAVAHMLFGVPQGDLLEEDYPPGPLELAESDTIQGRLEQLSQAVQAQEMDPHEKLFDFWRASKSSTQRISSRRIRFHYFVRALRVVN